MQQLAPIAAIAGLALFFVGAIVLVVRHKMKIKQVWREFANKNELRLTEGAYPSVRGTLEGRIFEMGVGVGRSAGGRAEMSRVVELATIAHVHGAVPEGLVAGKRGLLQGAGNVDVGDDKLWVDCPDVNAAKSYLTPARIEGLKRVVALDAVLLGPKDGQPARVFRAQSGYKVRVDWFEEQRAKFLEAAKALDA